MAALIRVDAGDLVATASASVTLAQLDAELAKHNAWLPLDPSGSPGMTLGECLAGGAGGPLSAGFGLPRDQVLGLSFKTKSGAEVKTGGRVVKNVAGFDLAKLLIGSRGRFGEITEAHLRLRIRPEADLTAIHQADDLTAVTRQLMTSGVNPVCFEAIDTGTSWQLGFGRSWTLVLRTMGFAAAAEEELAACRLPMRSIDSSFWTTWRQITGLWPTLVRIGADPDSWGDAVELAVRHLLPLGASVTIPRGTVRLGTVDGDIDALRRAAAERGWPVTVERGGDPWGDDLPAGVARLTQRLEDSLAAAASA